MSLHLCFPILHEVIAKSKQVNVPEALSHLVRPSESHMATPNCEGGWEMSLTRWLCVQLKLYIKGWRGHLKTSLCHVGLAKVTKKTTEENSNLLFESKNPI